MSGIAGIIRLDGGPVAEDQVAAMTQVMAHRGPDGIAHWSSGSVALAHCLLRTTPEAAEERQPLSDDDASVVLVFDGRIDNADDLRARLLAGGARLRTRSDAEIALRAYEAWGRDCPERFEGDFSFVVWDARRGQALCVRDRVAMRPLYFHHAPGRLFAFASDARALLAVEGVPFRLNEGRIADYLLSHSADRETEGRDLTFFEDIFRLPPGHALEVSREGLRRRRYWTLEPAETLRLPSDEAYADAFLRVFTEAVRRRLRSAGTVGSMLSGGMDSGSIVAVARSLTAEAGRGPLPTFSAIGPDPDSCVESRSIRAAIATDDIAPHVVDHADLPAWSDRLWAMLGDLEEPEEAQRTLLRLVYLSARRVGINTLLDGAAGDLVLDEGNHLARLLRGGRWVEAFRQSQGLGLYWAGGPVPRAWVPAIALAARRAFVPPPLRALRRALRGDDAADRLVAASVMSRGLAERVRMAHRLRDLHAFGRPAPPLADLAGERIGKILNRDLSAGRERYERTAAAAGVEPRDPFLDTAVMRFCAALPGEQLLGGGWPKILLRRAMAGRMPDAVRWRRGKQHVGGSFTLALIEANRERMRAELDASRDLLAPFVDRERLEGLTTAFFAGEPGADAGRVLHVHALGNWLVQIAGHATNPPSVKDSLKKLSGRGRPSVTAAKGG